MSIFFLLFGGQAFGSVAQDGNGWSQNTLGAGKKYIYVSSSGSDSNNGLTTGTPKLTVAGGIAAMSGGDGLLFNRGNTWTNQTFSGLPDGTTNDPTWVGYYGTGARPRFVITSGSSGIMDDTVNNVFFKGLHFSSTISDASNNVTGFAVGCTGSNYAKFEDCVFKRMGTNLLVTGGSGSTIRRCICIDATLEDPADSPSVYAFHSGMYSNFVTNLTIEENVFDQNGVLDESSVFNHNIYIDADTAGTTNVKNNILSRCPSSCVKMLQQSGTLNVYRNLLSTCGDQMEVGAYGGQGEYPTGTHTVPQVEENVIVEGTKEFTESPGWGIRVRHSTGGYIRNNVIANRKSNGSATESVPVFYMESVNWGPAVDDVEVYGNHRYNWRGADLWPQGANSGNLSHDNIIDEPNMDTSFGEPYVVFLEAAGVVTFTADKYNRGGTSAGWFDGPGATTFSQWAAASYCTSVTSGATTWTAPTRTLTTWLTTQKGQSDFDSGMTNIFRDEDTIEDTERITDIAAAHAWIAAGYNKTFGEVPPPEPAYTQASYQIFAGSGALPQPGSTTAASHAASATQGSTTATTSSTTTVPASATTGRPVYVLATSRDHTAGTTRMAISNTASDTWTLVSESTDRKAALWWTRAGASTASSTVTVSGAVGSIAVGCTVIQDTVASGDPHTNVSVEDNASGNETHAGFTPSQDRSLICLAVFNTGNDNSVTTPSTTNPGSLTQRIQLLNTGGNDCAVYLATASQAGAATATGNLTWAQTNGTTKSIAFAIKPLVTAASGRASLASQDVPVVFTSGTDYGVQARIRNSGDASGNDEYKWQYNHIDGDNTWHDLTTTTSNPVYIVATSDYANGADVPEFIAGTGTYVTDNNAALDTTGQLVTTAALAAGSALESHVNVRIKSGQTVDDEIQMRLVEGDGTVFGTYTNLPTIIVGPDSTPPTLSQATIAGNGTTLVLDFDKAVVGTEHLGWTLSASGGAVTTVSGSGSGTAQLAVNLSRTILASETVTISYSTSTGDLASSGNDLANITDASVTNESTQTPPEDPPVTGDKLLIGVGSGYLQLEVQGQ